MKNCKTACYFIIVLLVLIFYPRYSNADPLNNWHLRNSPGDNLYGVVFGNDTFVAVGYPGTILTSPDGTTWTARTSGTTDDLDSVAYGNSSFVAVGYHGTILTSPDGTTWTARTSVITGYLTSIAYVNGTFVTMGFDAAGLGQLFTSPDGVNWTMRVSGLTGVGGGGGITYGNGTFVAVSGAAILTSSDGVNWTAGVLEGGRLHSVTYGGGLFVAVGGGSGLDSAFGTILTSPDGVNWTVRLSDPNISFRNVCYGNGTFVAAGFNRMVFIGPGPGSIMTSADGITWEERVAMTQPGSSLSGITFGNNTFVAVGSAILQSDPPGQISPFVMANNLSGIVTLKSGDAMSLTISLDAANLSGVNADWWVAVYTQCGFSNCWYYYVYPDQWRLAPTLDDIEPAYQGPLFTFTHIEVLNLSGVVPDTYSVYFGVDTNMNGRMDFDQLYLDHVLINVMP